MTARLQIVRGSSEELVAPSVRVWTLEELFSQPEPEWLVEGMIPAAGDGLIYGATGTGKTFLGLDLGLTIATGLPSWFGRKVKGGPVAYVPGEGGFGLKNRVASWQRAHPGADPAFLVVPDGAQLMSIERTAELIAALDRIAGDTGLETVIFDTLARVTPGGDENSRQDMGLALASAALVRQHFGCSAWFLHHSGHDTTRARGSSSLLQAVDWAIRVELTDGNRVMKCDKQRDGAPFDPIGFRLTSYPPSMIVEPAEAADALDPHEEQALAALEGHGPVSATFWQSKAGLRRSTFFRTLKNLKDRGLVQHLPTGYQVSSINQVSNGITRLGVGGITGLPPYKGGPDTNLETGLGDSEEATERAAIASETLA